MTSGSWRRKARSAAAKVQAHLRIHVDLVDAGHVDFDRVLGGGDVAVLGVEDVEARVQGHRLAAAGRAGDQDHAVGLGERVQVGLLLEVLVAERVDAELGAARVEDTQHDLLAEQRRAGVDAEIDGAVLGQLHLDAAVLGQAPLGDVEPGHDLEARHHLGGQRQRRRGHLLQHAVEAGPDAIGLLVGLEVNVGRAALDGVQQDLVDEAHDRRVHRLVARRVVALTSSSPPVTSRLSRSKSSSAMLLMEVSTASRARRHDVLELVLLDDDRVHAESGLELDLVDGLQVGGVGHAEEQPLAPQEQGQDPVRG